MDCRGDLGSEGGAGHTFVDPPAQQLRPTLWGAEAYSGNDDSCMDWLTEKGMMRSEGDGNRGPGGQLAHQVPVRDYVGEGDCDGEVTWS